MTATQTAPAVTQTGAASRPGTITEWHPEDERFWAATGRRIARRNLIFSIFAEHLGFSVWTLWSVVVVALPATLFPYTVDQKFWLVALPNLIGALMRIPYTFAVTRLGGRTWTTISALLLFIPLSGMIFAVTTAPPYWAVLAIAASAGFGGGNFASSMTNISFFFPEKEKGVALGLNAAGGNIGISTMQLFVPMALAAGLVYGGLMWVPLVLAAALCARFFMNNLDVAKSPIKAQFATIKRPHTWIMSFLYIGTFGSFLGYSAAFPLVLKLQFPQAPILGKVGLATITLAFTGPLIGSLTRPLGGWLADRIGGARITAACFILMGIGSYGVVTSVADKIMPLFLASFWLLFAAAGAGNGSTYRMIPAIFAAKSPDLITAKRESAATLGIAGAIGAMGGFYLPRAISDSYTATGGIATAFTWFGIMYATCLAVTWWFYLRKRILTEQVPSLAPARV
ncbi:NNP family nitrate/nitrite transporter-like MFS transporter [Allocatelliglobosispora scoriae]|uniref:NNP family nitrate/nitrite transporter-like MFS transporter n=1 Tax=Allocatelliglobosispora scoriae TaxID=643052 RepID=A0A841BVN2_9ACTN|nr:nitrate/nitrite transporter [Allocatelliglobosispora scoriae]MBB5871518.1 NNP family nitrate/nitrite transporter-like MFS transporter [Allocatelliglobosispora scoriae]